MIPVTSDGYLVLVEQLRLPLNRRVIEIPAGLVDGGTAEEPEGFQAAASRELIEETGYRPGQLTFLFQGPPSAGISDEIIAFYLATELERVGPGGGDANECIEVHQVALTQVNVWLAERAARGDLIDPKIFTGLYFLQNGGTAWAVSSGAGAPAQ